VQESRGIRGQIDVVEQQPRRHPLRSPARGLACQRPAACCCQPGAWHQPGASEFFGCSPCTSKAIGQLLGLGAPPGRSSRCRPARSASSRVAADCRSSFGGGAFGRAPPGRRLRARKQTRALAARGLLHTHGARSAGRGSARRPSLWVHAFRSECGRGSGAAVQRQLVGAPGLATCV